MLSYTIINFKYKDDRDACLFKPIRLRLAH